MSSTPGRMRLPPSIARSPEAQREYEAHDHAKRIAGDESCDMCRLGAEVWTPEDHIDEQVLSISEQYPDVSVIQNTFPYDSYDGQRIRKHHLLIPLGHVASIGLLSQSVREQYIELMIRCDEFYDLSVRRTPGNATTSIPGHLHGHLMQGGPRIVEFTYDKAAGTRHIVFEDEV